MDILTHVKCTLCQELPGKEIFHCKSMHIICDSCLKTTTSCPSCSISLVERFRHLAFESLLDATDFNCENKSLGCKEVLKRGDLKDHSINHCEYGGMVSSLCKEIGYDSCPFQCKSKQINSIVTHFEEKHKATVITSSSANIHYANFSKIVAGVNALGYIGPPIILKRIGHEVETSFLILPICSSTNDQQKHCSWLCIFLGELAKEGKKFQAEFAIKSVSAKAADLQWINTVCCLENFVPFLKTPPYLLPWNLLKEYYCVNDGIRLEIRIQQVAAGPIKAKQSSAISTNDIRLDMGDGEGPGVPIEGTYALLSSENWGHYVKAIGRNLSNQEIIDEDNEKITIKISRSGQHIKIKFIEYEEEYNHELGKAFQNPTFDGQKRTCIATMSGNTLLVVGKMKGFDNIRSYTFCRSGMTQISYQQGVTGTRIFKRLSFKGPSNI